ncbi:hypothetical protein ACWD3Z_46100 [Streptomyces sp. NPDC002740]
MSAAKRESIEPGPEALAYGQALKAIFLRLNRSQREVAGLLRVDPAQLSRFFSAKENTVAAKEYADALVGLVRESGGTMSDGEATRLHGLRHQAQEASPRQVDRVAALQEQMAEVQALAGTFRGRLHDVESANNRLEDQVERLLKRVQEEEQRADRELAQRWQAEKRADWGIAEAATRLSEAVRLQDEAQLRATQAECAAEESAGELTAARKQLAAAAQYAQESDALLDRQREQLKLLSREVKILREQVHILSQEQQKCQASTPVAEPATQVRPVNVKLAQAIGEARLHEAMHAWVGSDRDAPKESSPGKSSGQQETGFVAPESDVPLDLPAELTNTPSPRKRRELKRIGSNAAIVAASILLQTFLFVTICAVSPDGIAGETPSSREIPTLIVLILLVSAIAMFTPPLSATESAVGAITWGVFDSLIVLTNTAVLFISVPPKYFGFIKAVANFITWD